MTEHEMSDYQSKETAWRYDEQIARAERKISILEMELSQAKALLEKLRSNSPRYSLFNWSA